MYLDEAGRLWVSLIYFLMMSIIKGPDSLNWNLFVDSDHIPGRQTDAIISVCNKPARIC